MRQHFCALWIRTLLQSSVISRYSKILVLSVEDESFCQCIDLESEPVAITKDGDSITIFTKNVKSFELKTKEWTVTEINCPFMNTLKEMECIIRLM